MSDRHALIIVDVQNDFLPGGALAVPEGDRVVAVCNGLAASGEFDLVVATQDWHPADHGSFAANQPGGEVGQLSTLGGLDQILWPVHCVQGSRGAELAPGLDTARVDRVFRKGTDPGIDSYSGFFDNGHKKATGMGAWLKEQGVTAVTICGLATDYCVKFTAMDARELGFRTTLVADGCRAVDLSDGDGARAIDAMAAADVAIRQAGTTLHEGRYLRLVSHLGWEFAQRTNTTGIVVIVPITGSRELVLVEQYRPPVGVRVIELPAGLAGDIPGEAHEALETAARRELVEETGFDATAMVELMRLPPTPGMVSEVHTFFLATGLRRVGEGGGDTSEDIIVHRVPLADAPEWLAAQRAEGAMVSMSVYAGLWFASRATAGTGA